MGVSGTGCSTTVDCTGVLSMGVLGTGCGAVVDCTDAFSMGVLDTSCGAGGLGAGVLNTEC